LFTPDAAEDAISAPRLVLMLIDIGMFTLRH
jgi:hypothetical protein